jgi:acyl-coenzyme A thioesterase PaaI-like protein
VTAAPVSDAVRNGDGAASIGFLATLVDINAAIVALLAGDPDWTATVDLALHATSRPRGRSVLIDSTLVRAGSNLVTVATEVRDGGDVDDAEELLAGPASALAEAATGLITFARIPRRASVSADGFDPSSMIGQRRALVPGTPPPPEPILDRIDLRVLDAGGGVAELEHSDYVRNSFGTINGGVLGLVFQGAAEAMVAGHVATDLQIHYLSQAKTGPLRTSGRILREGSGHAVCSIEARDAGNADALLAMATVTLVAPPF